MVTDKQKSQQTDHQSLPVPLPSLSFVDLFVDVDEGSLDSGEQIEQRDLAS